MKLTAVLLIAMICLSSSVKFLEKGHMQQQQNVIKPNMLAKQESDDDSDAPAPEDDGSDTPAPEDDDSDAPSEDDAPPAEGDAPVEDAGNDTNAPNGSNNSNETFHYNQSMWDGDGDWRIGAQNNETGECMCNCTIAQTYDAEDFLGDGLNAAEDGGNYVGDGINTGAETVGLDDELDQVGETVGDGADAVGETSSDLVEDAGDLGDDVSGDLEDLTDDGENNDSNDDSDEEASTEDDADTEEKLLLKEGDDDEEASDDDDEEASDDDEEASDDDDEEASDDDEEASDDDEEASDDDDEDNHGDDDHEDHEHDDHEDHEHDDHEDHEHDDRYENLPQHPPQDMHELQDGECYCYCMDTKDGATSVQDEGGAWFSYFNPLSENSCFNECGEGSQGNPEFCAYCAQHAQCVEDCVCNGVVQHPTDEKQHDQDKTNDRQAREDQSRDNTGDQEIKQEQTNLAKQDNNHGPQVHQPQGLAQCSHHCDMMHPQRGYNAWSDVGAGFGDIGHSLTDAVQNVGNWFGGDEEDNGANDTQADTAETEATNGDNDTQADTTETEATNGDKDAEKEATM